jgi:hypothetical protein
VIYWKALLQVNATALGSFPPPRWRRVGVGVDAAVVLLLMSRMAQSSAALLPAQYQPL